MGRLQKKESRHDYGQDRQRTVDQERFITAVTRGVRDVYIHWEMDPSAKVIDINGMQNDNVPKKIIKIMKNFCDESLGDPQDAGELIIETKDALLTNLPFNNREFFEKLGLEQARIILLSRRRDPNFFPSTHERDKKSLALLELRLGELKKGK